MGPFRALAKGPDGELYAGGDFASSGDAALSSIAVWDGTRWGALAGGLDGRVTALVFDNHGTLYAGGFFTHADGKDASGVARWDGTEWSSVGPSVNGFVTSLVFYDSKLTAGGTFWLAGAPADAPARTSRPGTGRRGRPSAEGRTDGPPTSSAASPRCRCGFRADST